MQSSLTIALISLACLSGGILVGAVLRAYLPEHHLRDDSKDVVKTAAGLILTLAALVLGLLVSSAKGSFDTMSSGITLAGAKIITLDRVLARYGPETKEVRDRLRHEVTIIVERVWPTDMNRVRDLSPAAEAHGIEDVHMRIRELSPQNELQRSIQSQALQISSDLQESRWLLIEETQGTFPTALIAILIFWLTVLYVSFGLFAPRNATVITALFICALSIAGSIFLIQELNRPVEGFIKVSSAPLEKALDIIGK
jgi:hypothetical protein